MKVLLALMAAITGGFLAYGIGRLVYWIRQGPSLLVGGTPIILAFAVMGVAGHAGYINEATPLQATATGLSLGMAGIGAFLFWSQSSWG